jgi:hypothetical protein
MQSVLLVIPHVLVKDSVCNYIWTQYLIRNNSLVMNWEFDTVLEDAIIAYILQ